MCKSDSDHKIQANDSYNLIEGVNDMVNHVSNHVDNIL